MARIKLDYDNAIRQAKRIRQAGEQCFDQARSAQKLISGLSDYWQGDSANVMRAKYEEWIAEQNQLGSSLIGIAERIESTAETIKTNDENWAKAVDGAAPPLGSGGGGGFR